MSKKILIIEDDAFIRELYERELQREGYEVISKSSIEDAEVLVNEKFFDMILIDIMLPGKSGLDFMKDLHEKGIDIKTKCIMLTNVGQEAVVKQGFEFGAKGYLIKSSFSPQQVITEINSYFSQD